MKKGWVCGLLLLFTAVSLTACGKNQGGANTPYPYSWKELRDGSVEITIRGELEEGWSWQPEYGDTLQVEQTEKGFSAVPLTEDAEGVVTFICQKDGPLIDYAYQICISMQTDQKGCLKVVGNWNTALSGIESAGEDTEHPYQWRTDPEEGLWIHVTTEDQSWQVMNEKGTLSVYGPNYDETGFTIMVRAKQVSADNLTIYTLESGFAIQMKLQTDEAGQITVTEHQEGAYTREKTDIPGIAELEEQFGTVWIPENTSVTECKVSVWDDGESLKATVGTVSFLKSRKTWNYIIAKDISQETLMEELLDGTEETQTGEVNGYTVTICTFANGSSAFWQTDDGRVCALLTKGARSFEDTLAAAAEWMGGQ